MIPLPRRLAAEALGSSLLAATVIGSGVMAQRHYRKKTDDADGDEGGFDEARGHVSECEGFVLPP